MMNKKYLFIPVGIIFCLFNFLTANAQVSLALKNLQSPNAASLGLFGKIPVSHFTGQPNISVPLYKLEQKAIDVSIDLSYHASGVRPDMHPGWVGLGFALKSGGVISRTVKSGPDDYKNDSYGSQLSYDGYYYNRNVLNTSNWNQFSYLKDIVEEVNEHKEDCEPDEFSFNFGEYSGNFYLHANGSWKVESEKPLKVTMLPVPFLNVPFIAPRGTRMQSTSHGMSQCFAGFIITTEDGTQYQFGGSTNAIEYSIGIFDQAYDEWCAGSWYLTKITGTNGEVIDFSYERDDFVNQMYLSITNVLGNRAVSTSGIFSPLPECSLMTFYGEYSNYNGKIIAPVYLSQISGLHANVKLVRSTTVELRYDQIVYAFRRSGWIDGYGVDFLPVLDDDGLDSYPNDLNKLQWKKLDQIRVEQKDGALVKAFNFTYNNNSSQRLMLQSVQELDKDLVALPPYTFSYDNSVPLPGYLANKVDHWGFYNGTSADLTNSSTYHVDYYAKRDPVASFLYAGILNKITYPTGGVTEFTYEPHDYSQRLSEERASGIDGSYNTNTLAGGLRIKKIVSYDPISPLQREEKRYFYVKEYAHLANPGSLMSSGILGGQSRYYYEDYRRKAFNAANSNLVYSKSIFSTQSVLPGSVNAMGSHVGYSEVVEMLGDGSYTIFKFTNFDSNKDDNADNRLQLSRTVYEPYNSMQQERGKLTQERQYNSDGFLLKNRFIEYIALNKENEYVPALVGNYANVCPNTAISVSEGTAYRYYTHSFLPASESAYEFDTLENVISSVQKTFTYDANYRLLKTEKVLDSKNQEIKTTYTYPFDYNNYSVSYPQRQMFDQHILSPVLQKNVYVNNIQRSAMFTEYSLIALPANFAPVRINTQTSTNSTLVTRSLAGYDNKGNLSWTRKNSADVGTSYLWGYSGQLPIAIVQNADYNSLIALLGGQLAVDSFRDIVHPSQIQVSSFLAPLYTVGHWLVNSYAHDPFTGLMSITDPRGKKTFFDYDAKLRLKGVRDFNGEIIKNIEYNYR